MDPINSLLTPYTLGSLLETVIAALGIQTVLVATGAFLGLAGYFAALPFIGVLGNTSPRVIVFEFIQQLVYVASGPLLLLLFVSSLTSYGLLLALYLPLLVATSLNAKRLPKLESYESMMSHRKGFVLSLVKQRLKTPFLGFAMIWGVLILEWTALIWFNPSMPLAVWLLITYTYLLALLMAAHSHGVVFQAIKTPFVKIHTNDQKEFEGFLVGKGEDHYVITTKTGDMVIQSNYVTHMVAPPELP